MQSALVGTGVRLQFKFDTRIDGWVIASMYTLYIAISHHHHNSSGSSGRRQAARLSSSILLFVRTYSPVICFSVFIRLNGTWHERQNDKNNEKYQMQNGNATQELWQIKQKKMEKCKTCVLSSHLSSGTWKMCHEIVIRRIHFHISRYKWRWQR